MAQAFDAAFYLQEYPDVREQAVDPVSHYLLTGWREHRDPTPWFSTDYYLETNPDVVSAGLNPFYHYLQAGQEEGRLPRRPGGFRTDILARIRSLDDTVLDWTHGIDSQPDTNQFKIASQIREALAKHGRGLVVSVSHDDYRRVTGGLQLSLLIEASSFIESGITYVHLYPATSLPVLAAEGVQDDLLLNVTCADTFIGTARAADVVAALGQIAADDIRSALVVHSLYGHSPEVVAAVYRALHPVDSLFWIHDQSTLCVSFALMRNDVSACGGPPIDSGSCRICRYGEERTNHVRRITALLDRVPFRMVAPSEWQRDFWASRHELGSRAVVMLPHCVLGEQRPAGDGPLRQTATDPVRVAFLGLPALHKGWPVFVELTRRMARIGGHTFYHFGSHPANVPGVKRINVSVTSGDRHAMARAVTAEGIDVAVLWSICPESFSFTLYEAASSGALVITSSVSGNLAATVDRMNLGRVYETEDQLYDAFERGEVAEMVANRRAVGSRGRELKFGRFSADLIQLGTAT